MWTSTKESVPYRKVFAPEAFSQNTTDCLLFIYAVIHPAIAPSQLQSDDHSQGNPTPPAYLNSFGDTGPSNLWGGLDSGVHDPGQTWLWDLGNAEFSKIFQ